MPEKIDLPAERKKLALLILIFFFWLFTVSILVGMIFLDFAKVNQNKTALFLGLLPFFLTFLIYVSWKRIKYFG